MARLTAESLRRACVGDLCGWHELPSDLSLAEYMTTCPRDSDWSGTAQLGRHHRETNYLWACVPGAEQKLRVWFEANHVILLDVACAGPVGSRLDYLPERLGEPPTALDAWLGTVPMPESELVFPRHGVAAFVNRETQQIW